MALNRYRRIAFGLMVGGLALVGLFLLLNGTRRTARAASGNLFVSPGGSGTACSQAAPCSLQTALAQATDGDTLYLAEGTYTGTGAAVITLTKSVTLYGGWDGSPTGPVVRDPEAHPTVLDGEHQRRVICLQGGSLNPITPTVDGFTIVRGNATGAPVEADRGGGIYGFYATPLIANNLITGNVASTGVANGKGGGIALTAPQGPVVITGNRVISNAANLNGLGIGGGIDLVGTAEAQVVNNEVLSNTATLSGTRGYGGGIAVEGVSADALVQDNQVAYNVAIRQGDGTRSSMGYGGGIYVGSHSVVLSGNVVLSNTAIITGGSGNGGGIAVMGSDDVIVNGNRVEYNIAQQGAVGIPSNRGGGLYCSSSDSLSIRDNLIRSNTASIPYTGGGGGVYLSSCGQAIVLGNTIEANRASVNGNGYGGGFHAYASRGLLVAANRIIGNTATDAPWGKGGGLYFSRKTAFTMTNNIMADNDATRAGGGVAFETGATQPVTGTLVHNTFAANDRGSGEGRIAIHLNDPYVTLVLTNNLIYSHTYGVYATTGSAATLYNTLFYANSSGDTGGAGAIT
ncbi:MAG TPA: hypothetical protein ENK56_05910, partial [Chloroflexi bacterium]|nr:hypothetical protein [Chloroflexota bacterium]